MFIQGKSVSLHIISVLNKIFQKRDSKPSRSLLLTRSIFDNILGMMQANDMRPRTAGSRPRSAGAGGNRANWNKGKVMTQPSIICSKITIETVEQGVKYIQS